MSEWMRIGELAGRAGVTLRTIRHYERLGLLPKGEREGNGQHYYPEASIARLEKIDQLKRLGLTLEEVSGVIDLYFSDPSRRSAKRKVLSILRQHLSQTDEKITALTKFRSDLQAHIDRFDQWLNDS
ncbi:DNA-binding transcriptional MerR regulator [Granulicella aggregans]|uniref:DNA-binding transcriptional MerR regulator n=1 Tax=Granulicella aggregans TaxID=474949 RepID=A0A7W7ZJN6_9BACT|nr:MerR family transcriptional regulator [Granulicella aggregans]MBB5061170.1 DNA-binding transcriptional MerR regulator [Granulicella aggregans]